MASVNIDVGTDATVSACRSVNANFGTSSPQYSAFASRCVAGLDGLTGRSAYRSTPPPPHAWRKGHHHHAA